MFREQVLAIIFHHLLVVPDDTLLQCRLKDLRVEQLLFFLLPGAKKVLQFMDFFLKELLFLFYLLHLVAVLLDEHLVLHFQLLDSQLLLEDVADDLDFLSVLLELQEVALVDLHALRVVSRLRVEEGVLVELQLFEHLLVSERSGHWR